jgi:nitrate reductase cytochrome c-type subunit
MPQTPENTADSQPIDRRRSWLPFTLGVVAAIAAAVVLLNRQSESNAEASPTSHAVRAQRRQYAGAPPVIPHPPLTGQCVTCHTAEGSFKPPLGFAPANPHTKTPGMSEKSRCRQCHAFRFTNDEFVGSKFERLALTRTNGSKSHPTAPPTIPHALQMRDDCNACHSGPAARPEIVCRHPERTRCTQCHVPKPVSDDVLVDTSSLKQATP